MDMGEVLQGFVEERQIPLYGVASAEGFKHALPGWHPHELMSRSQSVLVIGRPFADHPLSVDEKTHLANESWWEANEPVLRQVADWRGEIIYLLDQSGLGTLNLGGFSLNPEPTFSYRLAQHEAGLGVYGRFGVCLNPDFGCYYFVGVLLTDAKIAPSDGSRLKDFTPCEGCSLCAQVCPVKAIDASKAPTEGYDRDLCWRFILKIKQRHEEPVKVCSRCFAVCPWAKRSLPAC